MKLRFDRWWENGLVFKIARTKIHQNFLASKYYIKQHSYVYGFIWLIIGEVILDVFPKVPFGEIAWAGSTLGFDEFQR